MIRIPSRARPVAALVLSLGFSSAPAAEIGRAEVGRLIDRLARLESFDTGLSPVYGGTDFPPVEGQFSTSVGLVAPTAVHRRSDALKRLVEAGPAALPALLEHLSDQRPTQLVIEHQDFFGAMWYSSEMDAPEWCSKRERIALRALPPPKDLDLSIPRVTKHRVTVGDACFVIVGMITNRHYNAIRYQPTACIVINSPTHTPALAQAVRSIWGAGPTSADLRASLQRDFENGGTRAATRLLYYYPRESSAAVLKRLQAMIHDRDEGLADFLGAISWTPEPALRKAIRQVVSSTADPQVVVKGAPALSEPGDAALREEIVTLALHWRDQGKDTEAAQALLTTALAAYPQQAEGTLARFLQGADQPARLTALRACYQTPKFPVAPLRPLLDDRSAGFNIYLTDGERILKQPTERDWSEYRICDHAYELISRALGDEEAKCTGGPKAMDRRISVLKNRLATAALPAPFSKGPIAKRK